MTFTLGFNLVNLGRNTTREIQTTSTFLSFFEEIDISSVELKEGSVVQDPVVYHKLTSSKRSRFNLLPIHSYVISVCLLPNV